MKAAVYHNNRDVRIVDVPKPEPGDSEILVRVRASGICGTDVMEWYRTRKGPRILGHEIAGDVAEVGPGVDRFHVGDRVFVSHHVPCNACKYCDAGNHTACETLHKGNYDPGGFAEFVRVPGINTRLGTYVLPENVSYDEGTMIEPLACVFRGQRVIGLREGHKVLILGSGVSGLMNIRIAKLHGAEVVATDIHPYRLRMARECGADQVLDARELPEIQADRVIICTGALAAFDQAFRSVDRRGVILFFAVPEQPVPIPTADFWRNELTVTSSYGAAPVDLEESLSAIASGRVCVDDLITHRLPFDRIGEGFRIVADAGEALKVVVHPFPD